MITHRLCVVGLGLMGGAIAMAARRLNVASRVIGVAATRETIERAQQRGAVDEATLDLRAAARDADMVILCVPVNTILDAAATVIPVCREGTLITDIGSSKTVIVREIEALLHRNKAKVHFVGSHPLTGSEKRGLDAAEKLNLEGALCVLTPTPHTDIDAYHKVEDFWKALGLRTARLSPEEHDAVLARSSHLPHFVSAALLSVQSDRSLEISGPGLRDMARLAGSEPAMWTDVAAQNAYELGRALKELSQELAELSQEVELLARPGTPGAEAARERLFRFLADARQRYDKRYVQPEPATEPKALDAPEPEEETT